MMKKHTWLFLFIFSFYANLIAQEAVPFKAQSEFYLYGDAVVIGNNILSKDPKEPFNDNTVSNDDIDMVFVDIDNDASTFSSSSATLSLPKNHTKIKYAALYWSATYSYEQGYRQESNGQFLFQGKRITNRDKINDIKLKLPNGSYKNIKGDIIFDGDRDSAFTLNSPYACVADVTRLLRNADEIDGEYTVANIVATKGFVSGGSAAGWLLYVVYEAPTKNPKYITTYDGFAHVSNAAVKLKFNNFKVLEKGEIKTALTFAALEGDASLKEDECIFVNPISKRVQLLSTAERSRNNFFNSKITNSNKALNKRLPNSNNTLGFDIIAMDLPETSQPLVDNNTTEVELAFNTESDRFYIFFTAFQTEISKSFYEEKQTIAIVNTAEIEESIAVAEAKPKTLKKERNKPVIVKKEEPKPKKVVVEEPKKIEPKKEEPNKEEPVEILKKEVTVKEPKKPKPKKEESVISPKKEVIVESKKETYTPVVVSREKPLPIWLRKKQETEVVTVNESNIYQPEGTIFTPKNSGLVMNRENYEKLLTKEDYVYETQKFKRILDQETTYINEVEKGYYIIASLVYDLDDAVEYQNELIDKGVNSKILKEPNLEKYYVYLFNSENFYDVFMLRKAFIKSEFLEQVWILNINIEKQVIKKL